MVNSTRRQFLRRSGALAVASALSACGAGAGSSGTTSAANATAGGQADTVAAMVTNVTTTTTPLPNANFTLTSATAQSRAPYTLGYAFQKGDVPAGSSVTADAGTLQVIPKNTWPDGSLKFAVLSGIVDLAANTPKTINLSRAPLPAAATALDLVHLRFTNITAQIGAGSFGTVSWSGADWSSPFATWVSGPVMSSWIYRKPVGTDPHLVAWLEVRMYNNGMVEVLPWIENGYLQVAGPTNKSAHYTFTLGGTQRFAADIDLKHHQRTPLVAGAALSYWLAADASVTPKHNRTYLQATELVPTYMATVSNDAAVVQSLVTSFQPLQAGNFNYDADSMAATGYQDPIGLLPLHDVLYLTSDAPQAYGAVVRNGYSAGRWGIHYRDETTNRPPRFSSYPSLNITGGQGFKDTGGGDKLTPVASGGNPPQWDVAHSPSVGFMAYLVTGRWYFMEEVQFATTTNFLGNGTNSALRDGSKGLVQPCTDCWQTRASAWDWRARIQALAVTPDDDTALRSEFIASVEANIAHFYGRYVAQANNPYGWVLPGETYDDGTLRMGAPWQQDFVTATFGYAVALGLPISATGAANLASFFQWKAKSAIMRLGSKSGFWYINADPYNMQISSVSMPDYVTGKGPWLATDADVYAATYANPPAWLGSTEGALAGEIMPGDRALWGNLMPAIAYAVRHGVPGASDAFNRLTSASNWGTLRDAFNVHPVWGVQPAKMTIATVAPPVVAAPAPAPATGTPSWLAGAAVNQWVAIPGTAGAGGAAIDAYSGFAFKESTGEILIAAAGGHSDSSDNRVVSLSLMSNAPAWTQRMAASATVLPNVAYYPDGKPTSRHLYNTLQYVPQVNRLMLFGTYAAYGDAWSFGKVDSFNLDTNTWDAPGTWSDMPSGHLGVVMSRSTGEVWTNGLARWSPTTKAWTQPITSRTNDTIRAPIAHDTLRNQLFTLNWGDNQGYGTQAMFASIVPCTGSTQTSIKFNPSAAVSSFAAEQPSYAAMDYDPDNDRFLFYCGQGAGAGRIYVIKPNSGTTWDMSILTLAGSALPPATPSSGVHNRFRYVPALKGFVLMPSASANLYFIRTA